MARVPGREAFTFEDVAEMAPAAGALDLDPLPVRIRKTAHGARDLLVERRPATMGVELVVGSVQRGAAVLALVGAAHEVSLVFSGERGLGPLVENDPLLRSGEGPKCQLLAFGHAPPMAGPQ